MEVILDRTDALSFKEPFVLVSTENLGFTEITSVELRSTTTGVLSSVFDDLTIRVVPEPTSLCLLAAGLFDFESITWESITWDEITWQVTFDD